MFCKTLHLHTILHFASIEMACNSFVLRFYLRFLSAIETRVGPDMIPLAITALFSAFFTYVTIDLKIRLCDFKYTLDIEMITWSYDINSLVLIWLRAFWRIILILCITLEGYCNRTIHKASSVHIKDNKYSGTITIDGHKKLHRRVTFYF